MVNTSMDNLRNSVNVDVNENSLASASSHMDEIDKNLLRKESGMPARLDVRSKW